MAKKSKNETEFECSECGTTWPTSEDRYCPKCGHRGEIPFPKK